MAVTATLPRPAPLPIQSDYKPEASITAVPASTSIEKILEIIDRDGGLIVEDLVTQDELDSIQKEIDEFHSHTEAVKENKAIVHIPSETKLVPGLVGKSKTAASICENKILLQLQDQILAERFTIKREEITDEHFIDPLLSTSLSFNIGTGAPRQRLHRDDNVHGIKHSGQFDLKACSQFGVLVAGCETKRENGATMFVPGSHRWDDNRQPRVDEICFAEMKPGSVLIFLGSAFHGGGHNSVPNFRRVVHGFFFIRGTLRQEENQFLAVPRSRVLGMSEKMLSLLGYKQPKTVLGIVDNMDPVSDLESILKRANA